jgi:hypothetical protein
MPAKAGIHALPAVPATRARRVPHSEPTPTINKSFLLLFFKKEALSFSYGGPA